MLSNTCLIRIQRIALDGDKHQEKLKIHRDQYHAAKDNGTLPADLRRQQAWNKTIGDTLSAMFDECLAASTTTEDAWIVAEHDLDDLGSLQLMDSLARITMCSRVLPPGSALWDHLLGHPPVLQMLRDMARAPHQFDWRKWEHMGVLASAKQPRQSDEI